MRYPGGKGGSGVYQTIINCIPPHDVYIETHLGGGNILERKKVARSSIAIDIDAAVIAQWKQRDIPGLSLHHGDAVEFLRNYPFNGQEFVCADPPYMAETRRGGKLYRHEYGDEDHAELLNVLLALPCLVMISGYRSELYDTRLLGWQRQDYLAMTRSGEQAVESIWMNYAPPTLLHDLRYLGENFRERERIKRKKTRWRTRLEKLDPLERAAILEVLRELDSVQHRQI